MPGYTAALSLLSATEQTALNDWLTEISASSPELAQIATNIKAEKCMDSTAMADMLKKLSAIDATLPLEEIRKSINAVCREELPSAESKAFCFKFKGGPASLPFGVSLTRVVEQAAFDEYLMADSGDVADSPDLDEKMSWEKQAFLEFARDRDISHAPIVWASFIPYNTNNAPVTKEEARRIFGLGYIDEGKALYFLEYAMPDKPEYFVPTAGDAEAYHYFRPSATAGPSHGMTFPLYGNKADERPEIVHRNCPASGLKDVIYLE